MNEIDNEKLDKLYKLGATETPSKDIDLAILNEAKKTTSEVKYSHKWRYMMPAAASMVLVSLLYFENEPAYKNNLQIESAPQFKKQVSPVQDTSFSEKESEKAIEQVFDQAIEEIKVEINEMQQAPMNSKGSATLQGPIKTQGGEYKAPSQMQKSKALKMRSSGAINLDTISLDPAILKNIDDLIKQGEAVQAKQMVLQIAEKNPNMKIELKKLYPEYFEIE
ncbi:hypothetical protein KO527_23825 [Pseudoalteromonas sp. C2R02]|uniref:hypothetical protein n=1 Tax=Pseudoalteromonas sp. C2R02 TaxID=2841565 RepID=UPI001C08B6DD|nr:hypothetical protein [Pseudoalteromonas sp. C2R02]MBU2972370.1 hypothetical protein [Pseudoalteromonas sp. C2R02]